jgi:hypothetical protein
MTNNNLSYTTNTNSNALKYSNNALSLSDMTNNRNINFSEMNIKKKEIIIGEIILEVLKISKLELQDEVKNKISKEMEQIRIRISQEEVIKRISFVFENEIEVMIYQCAKNILLDIHRSLLYNQGNINKINEETNLNENRNINDTIALSVMTVVREMQEGKWLLKMIEANVKLSDGVNTIKERWGKMIKKIEDKKDRMNDRDRKRELRTKETNDKEKNKLLEIEKEIRYRIIDLSYRKLKERVWIGIDEMWDKNKEVIIRKIKELMEERASRKIDNNTVSEIKVNEMMISISEKTIKKLENNNWYHKLVKSWESRAKTAREVKLRYRGLSRRKKRRGHKKNKEKDKRKHEDEQGKWNWYNRDGKLSGMKLIKDTSKEQVLLYLAKTYYVD